MDKMSGDVKHNPNLICIFQEENTTHVVREMHFLLKHYNLKKYV